MRRWVNAPIDSEDWRFTCICSPNELCDSAGLTPFYLLARGNSNSRDQFPNDTTVDISKAEVAAGMAEGELFVIEP